MIAGEAFFPDRTLWKRLEADFAAWASGSFSREPSLFPPIRPVPTVSLRLRWATFVVPSLLMAVLIGFGRLVLPLEPIDGRPPVPAWQLALVGALSGLMWPYLLWTTDASRRSYVRQADRAAARAD